MKNLLALLTFFLGLSFLISCSSKEDTSTTTSSKELKTAVKKEDKKIDPSRSQSLEATILEVKEKFQDTEKNIASYTKKTTSLELDDGMTTDLIGYFDKNGNPRKVIREEVMGHGALTTTYYTKDEKMYFIFKQSVSEASVMGPFTYGEKRIYFDDQNIIRLLEKEQTVDMDKKPNLPKVPNKDITSTLSNMSGKIYFDELDKLLKAIESADGSAN